MANTKPSRKSHPHLTTMAMDLLPVAVTSLRRRIHLYSTITNAGRIEIIHNSVEGQIHHPRRNKAVCPAIPHPSFIVHFYTNFVCQAAYVIDNSPICGRSSSAGVSSLPTNELIDPLVFPSPGSPSEDTDLDNEGDDPDNNEGDYGSSTAEEVQAACLCVRRTDLNLRITLSHVILFPLPTNKFECIHRHECRFATNKRTGSTQIRLHYPLQHKASHVV